MNDQRKTKKQLLDDLSRERERSLALQEVSNKVAAAHDTDEILDLIVNEAARLVGTPAAFIRLLQGDTLVMGPATDAAAGYAADSAEVMPRLPTGEGSAEGRLLEGKKPVLNEDVSKGEGFYPETQALFQKHGFRGSVGIPLVANDHSIGTLRVFDNRIRRYTEDEVALLTAFADQAALALEKARLLNEAEQEKERSDALYRVSNLLASAHNTDEVLDLIVNEATRLVGANDAQILLLEGDYLVAGATTESGAAYQAEMEQHLPAIPVGEAKFVRGQVMATRQPIVTEDTQQAASLPKTRTLLRKYGLRGRVIVPLVANDKSIGVLVVHDKRVRRFTDDEVSLLTAFADQAALALEKARLLNEAETERERADSLYRVSNLLAGAHDTDVVLDLIVNEATRLVGAKAGFIRLLEGRVGVPAAATASAAGYLAETESTPASALDDGKTVTGQVIGTMKPLVFDDATKIEQAPARNRSLLKKYGLHGIASIPLVVNDQPIGLLAVFDGSVRLFTDKEVSLLTAFADQAALALEKARLLNEAETEKARAETERERSDALYRVSNLLAGAHDTDEVLDLIVNEAARLVGAPSVFIRLLDGDALTLRAAAKGTLTTSGSFNQPFIVEERASVAGHVMATKKPLFGEDAAQMLFPETLRIIEEEGGDIAAGGAVPLLANDQSIGTLAVWDFGHHGRRFTEDEISLLMAFADQAALALEKARLLNEAETEKERAETERERSEALYRVSNMLAGAHGTDEVLDLIVNEASRLLRAETSYIRLLEGDGLVLRAGAGPWAELHPQGNRALELGEEGGVAGQVMATKKPLFGEEAARLILPVTRKFMEERGMDPAAAGSVPLLANDQSIGTLTVLDTANQGRRFTEDEISLLMAFADQAALALEKARLLNEAESRTAELDATNQELEAFSYSVSHDLRAPLRGIDGFSQALMNEYSDVLDEQANHYLERVRTGSQRMGQLIDDLLALSRVTRDDMRRENVDLSDLARTIVTGLQERDPQRLVEFVIQDGVAVNGDTRLMRVALENLLGNAWKYTEKHQEARIEFGLTEQNGKRTCFVRDDGSGFDMAYADRLFGAFQRLHDQSEFEGSGIGLATVQRIIHRHGGQIWAEAAVEEGATFYFTLLEGDGQHG